MAEDPYAQFKVADSDPYAQFKESPGVNITLGPPQHPAPDVGTTSVEQAKAAFDVARGGPRPPGPDERTTGQVALDQYAKVGEGAYNLLRHPVTNALAPAAGLFWDSAMGRWSKVGSELGQAAEGMFSAPIRGSIAVGASFSGVPYNNAPTKEEWENHAKGAGMNAMGIVAGEVIGAGASAAAPHVAPILDGIVDYAKKRLPSELDFKIKPQTLITKGLSPTDKNFQSYVDSGLTELKAAQKEVGPIRDVPTAQRGLEGRWKTYDAEIKDMVKPREHQVVPGSAQQMIDRQIAAIPDDWKLHNAADYDKLVKSLRNAHPQDYTVGELNQVRSDLGKANSAYYGKDIQGQLTMDVGSKAVQMARETAARDLFYKGMDNFGEGAPVRELNSRVGAILHLQDELWDNLNKSIAERRPFISRNITRPIKAMKTGPIGVDENLAAAVKRWDKLPQPVKRTLATTTGTPQDLLPTGGPGMFGGPGGAGGAEPGVFTQATRTAEYTRLQRQRNLWTGAGPEFRPAGAGPEGVTPELLPHEGPGMLSGPQGTEPTVFTDATAKANYERIQHQKGLWAKGAAQAPTDLPLTQGQLSLERGMAPTVMGLDQSPLGKAAAGLNEGELLDTIDQYAKHNHGYDVGTGKSSGPNMAQRVRNRAPLWENMTPAERQSEFLATARQDLKNAVKEAGKDQEGYVKARAEDPHDPMAGVYKILYRRMRAGGQIGGKGSIFENVGTSAKAPRFGDVTKIPEQMTDAELKAAYEARPAAYHAETPDEYIKRISRPQTGPTPPPQR